MTCNQIPSKIALDKPKTRIQMQFRELKQQLNPGNEMRASSPKQNGQPKNLSEREKYVKLSMTYLLCIHLAQWSRSNEQLSVQVSGFCVRVHVNIHIYIYIAVEEIRLSCHFFTFFSLNDVDFFIFQNKNLTIFFVSLYILSLVYILVHLLNNRLHHHPKLIAKFICHAYHGIFFLSISLCGAFLVVCGCCSLLFWMFDSFFYRSDIDVRLLI